jgi:hypothetical protein
LAQFRLHVIFTDNLNVSAVTQLNKKNTLFVRSFSWSGEKFLNDPSCFDPELIATIFILVAAQPG